jgi:ankyrin repeat protein
MDDKKTIKSATVAMLIVAVVDGDIDEIKRLVDSGLDVNEANEYGETALMYAAQGQKLDVLECLIGLGSDVNAACSKGTRAVMAVAYGGLLDCMSMLLAAGAKVDGGDDQGDTALMCAVRGARHRLNNDDDGQFKACIKLLLDAGCDVDALDARGRKAGDLVLELKDCWILEMIEAERERRELWSSIGESASNSRVDKLRI